MCMDAIRKPKKSEREIASKFSIANGTAQYIVVEICGEAVISQHLNLVQNQHRKTVPENMISEANHDSSFMKCIICHGSRSLKPKRQNATSKLKAIPLATVHERVVKILAHVCSFKWMLFCRR